MNIRHILFLIILMFSVAANAQRVAKVEGEYELVVHDEDNITLFDAKQRCIELAKNDAIKREFGELVASDYVDSNVEINGHNADSYTLERIGTSARGEWLGDTREPELDIAYIEGKLYFKAHVWGEAREIVSSKTVLKWMIQHDGNVGREATTTLKSSERFFVNFLSPIDGYVAIYLTGDDGMASCLLPYLRSNIRSFPVKGGVEYTFFDKELDRDPVVDYLKLSADKARERYTIWLIFSPRQFTKCVDKTVDSKHPKTVTNREFREWKLQNQRTDHDMQIESKSIIVVNPNAEN